MIGKDTSRRPHILQIMVDDLGYGDAGFLGCPDFATPNLDRLAETSVRFRQAYVCAAICAPSRAGLLTGRMPQRWGCSENHQALPRDETTLAEVLGAAGYRTGLVGKWHLGKAAGHRPTDRGFAHFEGFCGWGRSYHHPDGYYTEVLAREAVRFIRDRAAGAAPFFLHLAFSAPHTPMEAMDADLAALAHITDPVRRTYAAMVRAFDRGLGWVLDALDDLGIADGTWVVFLSDHGAKDGLGGWNGVLRGWKYGLYEGGIRTPLLVRAPGVAPRDDQTLVLAADLFPTLLEAAGLAPDPTVMHDGRSLWRRLHGDPLPVHDHLVWRALSDLAEHGKPWHAVRTDAWKYHLYAGPDGRVEELYDLTADPGEARDCSMEHPGVLADLRARCAAWDADIVADLARSGRAVLSVPVPEALRA